MPGPPPPPPMAPAAPPVPTFSFPKGAGADDRGALLKSIRQGAKLKKTVTVDKSAPVISGKVTNGNNNSTLTGGNNSSNNVTHATPNGLPLAGLFAGGMPKLRSTGKRGQLAINTSNTNVNNNEIIESPSTKPATPAKNIGSIQDQLKKQLSNPSDTRNRGPPPPAPTRNILVEDSRNAKPLSLFKENSSNNLHSSQTSLHANISSLHVNNSTLHRKSKSNANLSSLDCTDSIKNGGYQSNKPVINYGKPNLAPKPPALNGKPSPPSKLIIKPNKPISRAQSMRSPRSPSPQSPTPNDANIKFGTVRNMTSLIGQSLASSQQNIRSRPPLTVRPSVPPPSVPPPAAPPQPKASTVKPPNHAPPPPPGIIPQAPSHAPPPPPPHKTQPVRPPPAVPMNNINPPPPPPRHSSMRDAQPSRRVIVDLEEKFKYEFATPDRFPRPPPYRNVLKLYTNKQESSC